MINVKNIIRNNFIVLVLSGIIFIFILSDIVWLKHSSLDPHWDMGRHLWNSIYYFNILNQPNHIQNADYAWTSTYKYYPPFTYFVTSVFYKVFHSISIKVAIISNIFFVCVLVPFTYLLSRIFLSKKSSLIAVIFILTTPIVFTQLHEYMLDVPSLAMFVPTLYFLLKSDHFNNRFNSIMFGLFFGLSMMTKWTFVLVIVGPLLWESYFVVRDIYYGVKSKNYKHIEDLLLNIFLSSIIIFAISYQWYISNYGALKHDLLFNAVSGKSNPLTPGIEWFLFYLLDIESIHLYLPYFLIFLSGLSYSIFYRELRKKMLFLFFSFVVSYLILTKINNKDTRYIIPLIIYIGIFSAGIFEAIKGKIWNYVIISIFIFYALLQVYYVSFYSTTVHDYYINIMSRSTIRFMKNYGYTSGAPVNVNYPVYNIVKYINNDFNKQLLNGNYVFFDTKNNILQTYLTNYHANFVYFVGDDEFSFNGWEITYYLSKLNSQLSLNNLDSTDKGGYLILHYANKNQSITFIHTLSPDYSILKTFIMPDGSTAFVIKLANNSNIKIGTCSKVMEKAYDCNI